VKGLLAKIQERENIIAEAKKYDDIKSYTREKVRSIYKDIVPLVSSHAKIPDVKIREHVVNFRFLSMQELIN
jgi:hypothetical protein